MTAAADSPGAAAGGPAGAGAPARPVIIVGNLTIDDVIQPDGTSQMGTLGGNSVHACAAALAWAGDTGIVARCGTDFPAQAAWHTARRLPLFPPGSVRRLPRAATSHKAGGGRPLLFQS